MKILVFCVIALALVESVFSAGAADCPLRVQRLPHLKLYSDSCLLLVTSKVTWNDARGVCRKMGGDLVTIKDADKQNFILQSLAQDHWNSDQIWIGANDKAHEGDWRWTDGSKLTYNRFASGQGSNHNSGFLFADGRGEDCAVLRRDDGGSWHDYPCSPPVLGIGYHYTYICEFAKIKHVTTRPITHAVTTPQPRPITTTMEPLAPTTMANVETPPTTMANVETPAPTTMANVETPAPTTMANVETPAPTTMANVETPTPTTMANVETPAPTTLANVETPAPTTMANVETPAPTTQANRETPRPTTMAQRETPPPTAIIGRR